MLLHSRSMNSFCVFNSVAGWGGRDFKDIAERRSLLPVGDGSEECLCCDVLCCVVLLCWGKYGMVSVWLGSVGSTTIYSTVQLWKCRKSTVFAAFGFTFFKPLLIFSHCCIYGWFYLKSLSFSFSKKPCKLRKKLGIFLDILKIFPLSF